MIGNPSVQALSSQHTDLYLRHIQPTPVFGSVVYLQSLSYTPRLSRLDPHSGRIQYANAGHDLPYWRNSKGVTELRATGMPLGLMPGMTYEEKETTLAPGECILLHSDGMAEAHNPQKEMFGFPRLKNLMAEHPGGAGLIDFLLAELAAFTGEHWEQEDDVTLVTLQRAPLSGFDHPGGEGTRGESAPGQPSGDDDRRTLAEFMVPSEPGNERQAVAQVSGMPFMASVCTPTARLRPSVEFRCSSA